LCSIGPLATTDLVSRRFSWEPWHRPRDQRQESAIDLLKQITLQAYPTYLYYNPTLQQDSHIDVGRARDVYDAVSDPFLNKMFMAAITIPADTARIVVLTPVDGEMRREAKRTLIDNVVVRYTD
jgi:hypothetical protein